MRGDHTIVERIWETLKNYGREGRNCITEISILMDPNTGQSVAFFGRGRVNSGLKVQLPWNNSSQGRVLGGPPFTCLGILQAQEESSLFTHKSLRDCIF